jgi:hypothetical protein
MSNTITCTSCQRPLRVPDDLLGEMVKCPACGNTFLAESAPPPPPRRAGDERVEEAPLARPARVAAQEDYPGDYRDDDYDRPRRRYVAEHRGTVVLVLGIIALVPVFIVPIILGPIAWVMGSHDLKEMRAGRMDRSGQSSTETGRMLGMIATIIYGILFTLVCLFYAFLFSVFAGAARRF